jgi:hypothetical protein
MSSAMLSRWPVLLSLPLEADDLDAGGRLTDVACERLFAAGRAAYFARCIAIDAADVTVVEAPSPDRGSALDPGAEGSVTVSVSVTELFPDRFVMEGRVRPAVGDEVAADLRCTVTAGEVTVSVRDDLIRMAHAASHWH